MNPRRRSVRRRSTTLFTAIRALQAAGKAIVYVSHRLHEVFTLTDRVTIMRNGQVVLTTPTNQLDHKTLIDHMTGRTLAAPLSRRAASYRHA